MDEASAAVMGHNASSRVTPKILGLTVFGEPFDPRSWSGSTRSLLSCLKERDSLIEAHSVDLTPTQKLLSAARHPTPNRRRLYLNVMKSRMSYRLRSSNANRVISRAAAGYNVVLQLGALFRPCVPTGVLHCSYHDGNTAVSRRSEFAYVKASPSVLAESWNNEQEFYPKVDLIFTMSEWLRQSMIHDFGADPANVFAVGAGPNLSYAPQLLGTPAPAPKSDKKAILFVGVDFEGKGGPTLIEAFRQVRKEIPDAQLKIVGCNPAIAESGVEVVGVLSKNDPAQEARLRSLYEEASLFALPTRFDCFGIAFVEAMYHRLPCLGSHICAIPEIIRDGETGFTLPPLAPAEWAHRMKLLLSERGLAQKMGDRAFEHAASRYSWNIVADRMLDAMTSRLATRRG